MIFKPHILKHHIPELPTGGSLPSGRLIANRLPPPLPEFRVKQAVYVRLLLIAVPQKGTRTGGSNKAQVSEWLKKWLKGD